MEALQSRASADRRGSMTLASDEDEAQVDPAVVARKLDRHLVPWLFSLGVLCYLDRTNLSFAALQLNRDLALSCRTYGLGASLFFISYAAFQMPSTVACARLGAPLWLAANIMAWGLVAAAFAAASSVPAFLALRFLLGATESAAFPGMYHHLSIFYSERELGPAYAKVSSCTALAQVAGAPLAAAILTLDGVGGLRGWQWLFLLEGGATVVFGVALRLCLVHSPARAHRILTHAEREWLCQQKAAEREAAAAARPHPQSRWQATLGVVRDWRVLWLAACWLLIAATMFGLVFFLPLIVRSMFAGTAALRGVAGGGAHHGACGGGGGKGGAEGGAGGGEPHAALIALATACPFVMGAVGMWINGRLSERANERHRHAGVPITLAAATLLLVPLALSWVGPAFAFALLSLAAGLCWSFHGPFFSWPALFLGEHAPAGFAFINSCGAVGGFIGPYLLGLLTDRPGGGLSACFVMLACFLGVAGAGILCFPAPGHSLERRSSSAAAGALKTLEEGDEDGGGSGGSGSGAEEQAARPRPRLKGGGGSSRRLQELECQPILPAGSARSG